MASSRTIQLHTSLQVGITDAETYVHRLGRCGRAGKSGNGLLLLSKDEAKFMLPLLRDKGRAPLKLAGPTSTITGGTSVIGDLTPTTGLAAVMSLIDRGGRGSDLEQVCHGPGSR